MTAANGTFAPLSVPTYRNIWLASMVANTGSLIQIVGSAWLMAEMSTPDRVALVQTATFLPMALFAILAGAISDMCDRRKVQIAALAVSLAGATLMTLASILGWMTPTALLGFCFLIGTGTAFFGPAWQSSVGEQVPRDLLPQAVGLNGVSYNVARSLGPALGGVLVAALGATFAFGVNALCFLPILFALSRWQRVVEVSRLPPEGLLRSVHSGLRYIVHMQPVRQAVLRGFLVCFIGSALQALMPLMARDLLGGGAQTYGILLGCFGVGAVSGIFVLQPLRSRFGNELVVRGGCCALGICLALLSMSGNMLLSCVILFVAGISWMVLVTVIGIALQLFVPRWVVGRAVATLHASVALGVASGSYLWGLFTLDFGVAMAMRIAAVLLVLSPLLGLVLRIADRNASPESDDSQLAEPDVKLGISGRSGPISIEVQYRIAPDKARDFYNLMREIQRIRNRNGAYDWALSREIADPWTWSERYRCSTWDDYLRLRGRRTLEESAIQQRAVEMHIGIEPIRIRRWLDRPSGSVRWREEVPDRGDTQLVVPKP